VADLPGRVSDRGRAGQEVCVAPSRIPRITPATNPSVPIGVIIPNRDRVAPMWNTLSGLQGQTLCPKWVTIADLGSSEEGSLALQNLAKFFQVEYLRIDYFGPWNKGLAFNTALKRTPPVRYIMQVDADIILRPDALEVMYKALLNADSAVSVPVEIPRPKSFIPSMSRFGHLRKTGEIMSEWSVGGCVAFLREWLFETRGIDEAYEGWGNQDLDLWDRAQKAGKAVRVTDIIALHQAHRPHESTLDEENVEKNLARRVAQWRGADLPVNPDGFGEGATLVT